MEATTSKDTPRDGDNRIQSLIERGEEAGCINLSELAELTQALELEPEAVESLYESIHARGIDLSDDCARQDSREGSYGNDDLATQTTDALQLFLNEVSRHRLLTAGRGGRRSRSASSAATRRRRSA